MPTLAQLPELVDAGFSFLWVRTSEPEEAERAVAALAAAADPPWQVHAWDCERGLRSPSRPDAAAAAAPTPVDAVRAWRPLPRQTPKTPAVLLLHNLDRFVDNALVAQLLLNQAIDGRRAHQVVVAVAPVVRLPAALEPVATVVELPRPDAAERQKIAHELLTDQADAPAAGEVERAAAAAAGLTRIEAENAYTLSLVRHGRLSPATVFELKAQALEKSAALRLAPPAGGFAGLVGLEALKSFALRSLAATATADRDRGRGVLLLGPPGVGKSQWCKALGAEANRPVLSFDVGAVMSKYVGESEANLRAALEVADAMAPCVLFVDEVEKAVAGGSGGDGGGDSGVARRLFGALLTWMNDHTSDVYTVLTANDVRALPPEFARSGRIDATWFIDLPDRAQREAIWEHYGKRYDLAEPDADDADWTGAEIEACCRIAKLIGCPPDEAAQYVVPVAQADRARIDALRDWAHGRCLAADKPGRYRRPSAADPTPATAPRRAVAKRRS